MKKILVADDHSVVRFGLKIIIRENFSDREVVEAFNGKTVMEQMQQDKFELVLLDLVMPDTDSGALMQWITSRYPETKILIVSMNPENLYGKRYLQLGAQGYLKKVAEQEEMIKAIATVLSGKKYVSEELTGLILEEASQGKKLNPFDGLTAREFQVAILLSKNQTLTQISEGLKIHYTTASTHKQRIYEKLNIEHASQLIELADIYRISD
ncbi:response regulator transcription factor [Taibaiella koreensis]|uniref:response regulator transcription factor n=1 Tax=Taibaiella koreensis TaxID=1268548 RepID=UPI000E59937E|nr:response regulator transcription factor [Taibaiella koreensis]